MKIRGHLLTNNQPINIHSLSLWQNVATKINDYQLNQSHGNLKVQNSNFPINVRHSDPKKNVTHENTSKSKNSASQSQFILVEDDDFFENQQNNSFNKQQAASEYQENLEQSKNLASSSRLSEFNRLKQKKIKDQKKDLNKSQNFEKPLSHRISKSQQQEPRKTKSTSKSPSYVELQNKNSNASGKSNSILRSKTDRSKKSMKSSGEGRLVNFKNQNLIFKKQLEVIQQKVQIQPKFEKDDDSKIQSNTEIFQDLLIRACVVQAEISQKLVDFCKAKKEGGDNVQKLAEQVGSYPLVSKKSRSFKEIATILVQQMEFIHNLNFIKQQETFNQDISKNKNTQNLLIDQQRLIEGLKKRNSQLFDEISVLQDQAIQQKTAFDQEIRFQHDQMEELFKKMQINQQDQTEKMKKDQELKLEQRDREVLCHLDQLRQCQAHLKQLNIDREIQRQKDQKYSNHEKQVLAGYLDLGKKNFTEILAEVDYFKEKTQSLETEVKTMVLEISLLKQGREDQENLKNIILNLEQNNMDLHVQIETLQKQKDFFEKEYKIQTSQLQNQDRRLQETMMKNIGQGIVKRNDFTEHINSSISDIPIPRQAHPHPTDPDMFSSVAKSSIAWQTTKKNPIQEFSPLRKPDINLTYNENAYSKSYQKKNFNLNIQSSKHDLEKNVANQARTIEKLLLKIKKLQMDKVNTEFSIFNMDKEVSPRGKQGTITLQGSQPPEQSVQVRIFQRYIEELYQLILTQSASRPSNLPDHNEQFLSIKSYLSLQQALGNLKKYKFDFSFSQRLSLNELQNLKEQFQEENVSHKIKLQSGYPLALSTGPAALKQKEIIIEKKNEVFKQLTDLTSDIIGQCWVIWQQAQYQKNLSKQRQEQIQNYDGALEEKKGDGTIPLALFKNIRAENEDLVQKIINLESRLDVYQTESQMEGYQVTQLMQIILGQDNIYSKENTSFLQGDLNINSQKSCAYCNKSEQFKNRPPMNRTQSQNRSNKQEPRKQQSVFGGKKIWMKPGLQKKLSIDPDLNEAIDRIEQLEQELFNMDKEMQLLIGDNKKLTMDFKELEEALKNECNLHQEADSDRQKFEKQIQIMEGNLKDLEEEKKEQIQKIERLSSLNEEFQELINQERNVSQDEISRLSDKLENILKTTESKQVLLKNRLTQISANLGVFIAGSFTNEQIAESILDKVRSSKTRQETQKEGGFKIDYRRKQIIDTDLGNQVIEMKNEMHHDVSNELQPENYQKDSNDLKTEKYRSVSNEQPYRSILKQPRGNSNSDTRSRPNSSLNRYDEVNNTQKEQEPQTKQVSKTRERAIALFNNYTRDLLTMQETKLEEAKLPSAVFQPQPDNRDINKNLQTRQSKNKLDQLYSKFMDENQIHSRERNPSRGIQHDERFSNFNEDLDQHEQNRRSRAYLDGNIRYSKFKEEDKMNQKAHISKIQIDELNNCSNFTKKFDINHCEQTRPGRTQLDEHETLHRDQIRPSTIQVEGHKLSAICSLKSRPSRTQQDQLITQPHFTEETRDETNDATRRRDLPNDFNNPKVIHKYDDQGLRSESTELRSSRDSGILIYKQGSEVGSPVIANKNQKKYSFLKDGNQNLKVTEFNHKMESLKLKLGKNQNEFPNSYLNNSGVKKPSLLKASLEDSIDRRLKEFEEEFTK